MHRLRAIFFIIIGDFLAKSLCSDFCFMKESTFVCENVTIREFLGVFDDQLKTNTVNELEIIDGYIPELYYMNEYLLMENATSLKINNCGLKIIDENTFVHFENLRTLDLSHNQIGELWFLDQIPDKLHNLYLKNNSLTSIDFDFSEKYNIKRLDVSYNRIKIIDIDLITTLKIVILDYNEIYDIYPSTGKNRNVSRLIDVRLTSNKIPNFFETYFDYPIDYIDLGGNDLEVVEFLYNKKLVNLSYSYVGKVTGGIMANVIDLSGVDNIDKFNLISRNVIITNKELALGPLMDVRKFFSFDNTLVDYLDLHNDSIAVIPDYYFSYMSSCKLLNLSHNKIDILTTTVFQESKIQTLDLSHSKIRIIKAGTFHSNVIKTLHLNNNRLLSINKMIFYNSSISYINLSHNKIEKIGSNAFKGLRSVTRINLAYNEIEIIEFNAFKHLKLLKYLNLENNKLVVLQSDLFNSLIHLKELNLSGNLIEYIERDAFNNLPSIKSINLSNMSIEGIESEAFSDLIDLEEIDLSSNKIDSINNIFVDTPALKRIDLSDNPIKLIKKLKTLQLKLSLNDDLVPKKLRNINVRHLIIKNTDLLLLKSKTFKGFFGLLNIDFQNTNVRFIDPEAFNNLFYIKYITIKSFIGELPQLPDNLFVDMTNLEELDLSEISLQSIQKSNFNGLKNVVTINLSRNNLTLIENNTFINLDTLFYLFLNDNQITQVHQHAFNGLPNLKTLSLGNNRLHILIDGLFYDLPSLTYLDLKNNALTKLIDTQFNGLLNLEEIDLSGNKIDEINADLFRTNRYIKKIDLHLNLIEKIQIGALNNIPNLESIDLSYNKLIEFDSNLILYSATHLKELYLNNNNLKSLLNVNEFIDRIDSLKVIKIDYNYWECGDLIKTLELFDVKKIDYHPDIPIYNKANIAGIDCFVNESINSTTTEANTEKISVMVDAVAETTEKTYTKIMKQLKKLSQARKNSTTLVDAGTSSEQRESISLGERKRGKGKGERKKKSRRKHKDEGKKEEKEEHEVVRLDFNNLK